MATTFHPNDVVISLRTGPTPQSTENQITLSGLSDSDTAIQMPDQEYYANIRTALNGLTDGTLNAKQGGPVTFEFIPTSEDTKWFLSRAAELRDGENVKVHGTMNIERLGTVVNFRNGLLTTVRPGPSFGTGGLANMPFTVQFEEIAGDWSGLNASVSEGG